MRRMNRLLRLFFLTDPEGPGGVTASKGIQGPNGAPTAEHPLVLLALPLALPWTSWKSVKPP